MYRFAITTDNNSDLPLDYLKTHQVGLMSLTYTIENETYDAITRPMPVHMFYEKMRQGCMPTTAQVNPEHAEQVLEQALQTQDAVLHIAFSSGLSGTYQSVCIAAAVLEKKYPNKKIYVVDSLSASLGQGLLVHFAVTMRDAGKTVTEALEWCMENRHKIAHIFTVDDLFHLYRGGRVSKTSAIVGSMLHVKPILHVDEAGKLIPVGKVRGRKWALQELVHRMEQQVGTKNNQIVFISHADCQEDAEMVRSLITQKFGIEEFLIAPVGPVIGAHTGAGTVALFFLADTR